MTQTPIIVAYWLDEEITSTKNFPCPPLGGMGDLKQPNGNGLPQISVVCLMNSVFLGTQENFGAPYFKLSDSIQAAVNNGEVAKLQQQGIKVVLTILSNDSIGWSSIPASENAAFAAWAKSFLDANGLDGIDVDDENLTSGYAQPAYLLPTLSALRQEMPVGQYLITKALWQDTNCFNYQMSDGTTLPDLIDFGSTMTYGNDLSMLQSTAEAYNAGNVTYPLGPSNVCVGIQPGPTDASLGCNVNAKTSLGTAVETALWAKANFYLGVMIYTYSQDVTAFTTCPQYGPYPAPDDHGWQRGIAEQLFGNAI